MANIRLDALSCGMVLARDVRGKNGRLLVAGGTCLESSHLRVMRIWGVTEAAVRLPEDAAGAACGLEEPHLGAAEDLAARQFRLADRSHPAVAELYRLRVEALAAAPACPLPGMRPLRDDDGALPPAPPDPEALIAADPSLATFSDVYFRLREALDDPRASAGRMAEIIGRDPGLAASLLRLANSPFYGFSSRIDSLVRGVMVIGSGELALLALGISVAGKFRDIPPACLTMRQAWEHAVGCGVLARVLAAHKGGLPLERLFVAGLLHDVGRLVLLRRLPRQTARAMRLAREEGVSLREAESRLLGYDHAAVGRALLAHWHLPPGLCEAVGGHHGPAWGAEPDAALVHVADVVAVSQDIGGNGSPLVPPLDKAAWERLDLPVSVLAVALSQARRQVGDIVSMLAA